MGYSVWLCLKDLLHLHTPKLMGSIFGDVGHEAAGLQASMSPAAFHIEHLALVIHSPKTQNSCHSECFLQNEHFFCHNCPSLHRYHNVLFFGTPEVQNTGLVTCSMHDRQ